MRTPPGPEPPDAGVPTASHPSQDPEQPAALLRDRSWLPHLPRIVGLVVRAPDAEVVAWSARPLGGVTRATHQLDGTARTRGRGLVAWTLVLKRLARPAGADGGSLDPSRHGYWRREALAYRSGYLHRPHPGLRAPGCYAETPGEDGSVWLWLEAVDGPQTNWSMSRYALAAEHLARWAAEAARQGLPDFPWLCRGFHRDRFGEGRPLAEEFLWREDAWEGAAARGALPGATRALAQRVARQRPALLSTLAAAPQAACHLDAHRLNLLERGGPTGPQETVAVDWGCLGVDALGSDPGQLVAGSVLWRRIPPDKAVETLAAVLGGYGDGLRVGGAAGQARDAVRACYASLLLRLVCFQLPLMLAGMTESHWSAVMARTFQCPFETQVEQWTPSFAYLLEASERARRAGRWG